MALDRPPPTLQRVGLASFNVELDVSGSNPFERFVESNCLDLAGTSRRDVGTGAAYSEMNCFSPHICGVGLHRDPVIPTHSRTKRSEILRIRFEPNDPVIAIVRGTTKFGNGIAVVSAAVNED